MPTIRSIAADSRCAVHNTVLGIRDGKEGWWNLFCPGGICCVEDGELFGLMVKKSAFFFLRLTLLMSPQISALIFLIYFFDLADCFTWTHLIRTDKDFNELLLSTEKIFRRNDENDKSLYATSLTR